MKISEILSNLDIPSKEIKTRFKNNQIKVNGDIVQDMDLDINLNFIMEAGDFISSYCTEDQMNILKSYVLYLGVKFDDLFGEEHPIEALDNLSCFIVLRISKVEAYILMKN